MKRIEKDVLQNGSSVAMRPGDGLNPESIPPLSQAERSMITANILSMLLLRIASRTSFVVLSFYLGARFASTTTVVLVLEAFYVSEFILAPIVGSLTDRLGRKPFLLAAPIVGCAAALCQFIAASLFPRPDAMHFDTHVMLLLLVVMVGRLLEGATTGINAPASLGSLTDVTIGREKLRIRVMTIFEIATVGGLALAIPFGGKVSNALGIWGFFVVMALHLASIVIIATLLKESAQRESRSAHSSLFESLRLLRYARIFTFLPAWLAINALVGAWITLCTLILAYPEPAADVRFPHQLLYGGFSQTTASLLVGAFGLVFLLGMGLWMLILPGLRRTTVMCCGLVGLGMSIGALVLINGLGENPTHLPAGTMPALVLLLLLVVVGIFLLSGFTPAALTQMAAIAETFPGKRGAVMGLYSVVLGMGQLLGAVVGGISVDLDGFYGLMGFSAILGAIALGCVLFMRLKRYDCI